MNLRPKTTGGDAWYSRVNKFGDIACGAEHISVNDGPPIVRAIGPNWYRDRTTLFVKGFDDRPYELDIATGELSPPIADVTSGGYAAGNGRWLATSGPILWVACSREGLGAYIEEHGGNNNDRSLFVGGQLVVPHAPIAICRVENDAVTWTIVGRGQKRHEVWGRLTPTSEHRRFWSTAMDELYAVPVWTPHGWMVLIQTHVDLRLVWWHDNTVGKVISTGENWNQWPDACWVNDHGHVSVVWNGPQGQPGRLTVRVSDFSVIHDGGPVDPPPPPPPPENKMELPRNVYETFRRATEKYPHLPPEREHQRREAMLKSVGTVRARHGKRWITKSEHNTGWNDQGTDSLCYVPESVPESAIRNFARIDMFIWDLVDGLSLQPQYVQHSEPLRKAYALLPEIKDWLDGEDPVEPGDIAPGQKHAYVRDDDERNECDVRFTDGEQCNATREDPIHQIAEPDPLRPHVFINIGQRGCGFPDCGRALSDTIHIQAPTDPTDPVDPTKYHKFESTGRFCVHCGKTSVDAVHQKPAEPPPSGDIAALLASNTRIEDLIVQQNMLIQTAAREVTTAIKGIKLLGQELVRKGKR